MIAQTSRVSLSRPIARDESGTTSIDVHPVASLEHRTFVHPVSRGDCLECLPAACVCGSYLCELAFEHHRATAGSENYWRAVAA